MKEHLPETTIPYYVSPKLLQVLHREMNLEYKTPGRNNSGNKNLPVNNANDDDDIRDDIGFGTNED